jgi:Uma2 family endonuclease
MSNIMHKLVSDSLIIPALENGDRLTRGEFERRYANMPDLKKAELIERIVYMGSPLRIDQHGEPHVNVIGWLTFYKGFTPNLQIGDNTTVCLDSDNEPQPDVLMRIIKGGQSIVNNKGYVEGPPELIVEIAASTVSIDLHDKLKVYRRNRVQEYIVWRVQDQEVDWFKLREGEYIKLLPDNSGVIKSEIFPGLWLDVNDLLAGDFPKLWAVVQAGINTTDHQTFVETMTQYSNAI